MFKSFCLVLLLFLIGCSSSQPVVESQQANYENVFVDVVSKQLQFGANTPEPLQILIREWFNSDVKVNGTEGSVLFIMDNYQENLSAIEDGKRVDLSLAFQIMIDKPALSQKKIVEGSVNSFSTLTGSFSLADVDRLIANTQSDLVVRLSEELQSKL
jgi:hypothetical protein